MAWVVSVESLEYIDYLEIIGIFEDEHDADLAKLTWFRDNGCEIDSFGFGFHTVMLSEREIAQLYKLCGLAEEQVLENLVVDYSEGDTMIPEHCDVEAIYELCTKPNVEECPQCKEIVRDLEKHNCITA